MAGLTIVFGHMITTCTQSMNITKQCMCVLTGMCGDHAIIDMLWGTVMGDMICGLHFNEEKCEE